MHPIEALQERIVQELKRYGLPHPPYDEAVTPEDFEALLRHIYANKEFVVQIQNSTIETYQNKIRELADEFDSEWGPFPNGFQYDVPIRGDRGVVARLRALLPKEKQDA